MLDEDLLDLMGKFFVPGRTLNLFREANDTLMGLRFSADGYSDTSETVTEATCAEFHVNRGHQLQA